MRACGSSSALAASLLLLFSSLGGPAAAPAGNLLFLPVFLLAYSLGTTVRLARSAVIMAVLLVSAQVANGIRVFNPFILVAVLGPWAFGLAVGSRRRSCRFTGSTDGVPRPAAQAAYRVVQESLTNALRHSPGAPVAVVIARKSGPYFRRTRPRPRAPQAELAQQFVIIGSGPVTLR